MGAFRLVLRYDRAMPLPGRPGAALLFLAGALLLACGASTPPAEVPLPLLGSDATCADRAQTRPVCLQAVETRCASQQGQCEASCEPRSLPGSSEKHPDVGGDMAGERCRESCRGITPACRQALLPKCPTLCDAAGDWLPPRGLW
jgi:hypothetical protein